MGIFRYFLFLIFLLTLSGVWALTLTEALSIAAFHPALSESRLNIEEADSASIDAGKRGADGISLETENISGRLPGFSRAELTISFRREIIDRKKTQAQKRLAALSIDATKLDFETLKREIANRVEAAFQRVIGLQNLYHNAQEFSRINREMFEATEARVEAGASPEQEIFKARLDIERGEIEQKNLEGRLAEAMLNLFREMGIEALPEVEAVGTLTPEIDLQPIAELHKKILEIHPTLLSVEQSLKENSARFELLKAENRPSYSWVAGARNFAEEGTHGYVFAVEAEIPNRVSNSGARKAARIEKKKIETAREKAQRELLTTLQEQVKRFKRCREAALILRDHILPSAHKILEISLDGYKLGKTDQVVVLEARKAYAEVMRESLMALSELYEAANAIEQLTGVCLFGQAH